MSENIMKDANEKYVKYYVDILKQTLNEQVLQNISLKASAKVNDEISKDLQEQLEVILKNKLDYEPENQRLKIELEQRTTEFNSIKHQKDILQQQVEEFNKNKTELNVLRNKVVHLETFKNELLKTQELVREKDKIIGELNARINELNKPAQVKQEVKPEVKPKKKKVGVSSKVVEFNSPPPKVVAIKTTTVEDGGSF